jgi:hypothetical protein
MKNKLFSLLTTVVAAFAILAATTARADYYVVYDVSDTAARCDYVSHHHYRHHYSHHASCHTYCHPRHHVYHHACNYPMRIYSGYQVVAPNSGCNTCGGVPPSAYTCHHVDYMPNYPGWREYSTVPYVDNDYNGDMRTVDDDGS